MTANAHPLIQQMASDSGTVLMVRCDYTHELPSLHHLCILISLAGWTQVQLPFSFFLIAAGPFAAANPGWRCGVQPSPMEAEQSEQSVDRVIEI